MADIKIPPERAKTVIQALLRQQGGLAALAAGNVPAIVNEWDSKGVSLYVDEFSALGRALLAQGLIKK